jgi:hypothetical protein
MRLEGVYENRGDSARANNDAWDGLPEVGSEGAPRSKLRRATYQKPTIAIDTCVQGV